MTELEPIPSRVYFADAGNAPYQALAGALRALQTVECTHWITYGTLLGWVREGDFLPHDHDIDIAVIADTDPKRVIEAMAEQGLRHIQQSVSRRGVVNQKFVATAGTMVDIGYVFAVGDAFVDEYKVVGHSMANSTHPRQAVQLARYPGIGVPVPLPQDPAAYLASQFGPSWRLPVKQWDWVFSPPNVRLHLRPADLPILIGRWGVYRYRRLRFRFRTLFQRVRL